MAEKLARRRFLAMNAAALGAAAVELSWAKAAERNGAAQELPFTLGFSLYGMKDLTLDDAIRTCAKIGFHDVEPALLSGYETEPKLLTPARRKEVRVLLDSLGVRVPCVMENIGAVVDEPTHAGNIEKIARAAELAHAWKPADPAPAIMETVLGGKPADWQKLRSPMVERLGQWADAGTKHDLIIAIKAHIAGALHTPQDLAAVVREVNSPHLRAVFDFSHFQVQGFELEKSLRTAAPETVFIHVKDGVGVPGKFQFLLPGEGNTDYVAYFRLLKELGYAGSVTVEVSAQIHKKAGYDGAIAAQKCFQSLHEAYVKAAG